MPLSSFRSLGGFRFGFGGLRRGLWRRRLLLRPELLDQLPQGPGRRVRREVLVLVAQLAADFDRRFQLGDFLAFEADDAIAVFLGNFHAHSFLLRLVLDLVILKAAGRIRTCISSP